jgi:flagellar basal-body rod modification protein FlgD
MAAVDQVSGVTTTTSTPKTQSTSDSKSATINYESFLKLLVAQMQNQDPTDPLDASQQMSQLASFSGVEQAIKTNAHLESLIQETSLTQATSLIGKSVTSADGKTSGIVKSVEINSDGLTAVLEDGKKVTVETGITVGSTAATGTETDTDSDTGTETSNDDTTTSPDDTASTE